MKKQNSIRNVLGITQQDMAMLLNVSRGQWSMYECGRRDLPKHAVLLLAEIVTYLKSAEAADKINETQKDSNNRRCMLLEQLLHENQYERLLIEKKSHSLEKQLQADKARRQLSYFVAQRAFADKGHDGWPLVAPKVPAKNFEKEDQLLRFELRAELLTLEKLLLESKLQKITTNVPNINTAFRPSDEKA